MELARSEERGQEIVNKARLKKLDLYLDQKYEEGQLREELYVAAKKNVISNILKWMNDPNILQLTKNFKRGIEEAVETGREEDLVYAFLDDIAFGTGGIRGLAAFNLEELRRLAERGIDAPIIKGPNMTVSYTHLTLPTIYTV